RGARSLRKNESGVRLRHAVARHERRHGDGDRRGLHPGAHRYLGFRCKKKRKERGMKIAFLGGGNMATALIGGLIAKGHEASRISVIEMSPAAREELGARYPVRVTTAPDDAMRGADTLGLAGEAPGMKRPLAPPGPQGPRP